MSGTNCGETVILLTHSDRIEPCLVRKSLISSGEPVNGGICVSKKKRVSSYFPGWTIRLCTYRFCMLSGTCHSMGSVTLCCDCSSCSASLMDISFSTKVWLVVTINHVGKNRNHCLGCTGSRYINRLPVVIWIAFFVLSLSSILRGLDR